MDLQVNPTFRAGSEISATAPINQDRWTLSLNVQPRRPRSAPRIEHLVRDIDGHEVTRHFSRIIQAAPQGPGSINVVGLVPEPADMSKDGWTYMGRVSALELFFKARLMDGKPRPEDVEQGGLGNCSDISVLAAVAHRRPEQLAKRFSAVDREGTVAVHMWGGPDRPDDQFWVSTDLHYYEDAEGRGHTVDVDIINGVLWPMAAERALAAIHPNGYEDVSGGNVRRIARTMERLTGHPASIFAGTEGSERDLPGIARKLRWADIRRQPVVIGLDFAKSPEFAISSGLDKKAEAGHAFWLERCGDANTVLLRDQRNPFRPALHLHLRDLQPMLIGIVVGMDGNYSQLSFETWLRKFGPDAVAEHL